MAGNHVWYHFTKPSLWLPSPTVADVCLCFTEKSWRLNATCLSAVPGICSACNFYVPLLPLLPENTKTVALISPGSQHSLPVTSTEGVSCFVYHGFAALDVSGICSSCLLGIMQLRLIFKYTNSEAVHLILLYSEFMLSYKCHLCKFTVFRKPIKTCMP